MKTWLPIQISFLSFLLISTSKISLKVTAVRSLSTISFKWMLSAVWTPMKSCLPKLAVCCNPIYFQVLWHWTTIFLFLTSTVADSGSFATPSYLRAFSTKYLDIILSTSSSIEWFVWICKLLIQNSDFGCTFLSSLLFGTLLFESYALGSKQEFAVIRPGIASF